MADTPQNQPQQEQLPAQQQEITVVDPRWQAARRMMSPKLLALILIAGASLALVAYIINRTSEEDFQPLMTNLSPSDADTIIKQLEKGKVPYAIAQNGQAILVPPDRVLKLRMEIAGEGLVKGSSIGFELFDQKSLGMTEFTQKLNYQRALQGELARTIGNIDGVESARVHIVIPEKSLFMEEVAKPTASIIISMKSGSSLTDTQINGVTHLVAASVEGLEADNISIVDQRGRLLSKEFNSDMGRVSGAMLDFQKNVETDYGKKVTTLLESILGPGKVMTRVSADLDYERVETTEEKYDPDSAVVKEETRTQEKFQGNRFQPTGVPGATANNDAASQQVAGNNSDRLTERNAYEINKETRKTLKPSGKVKRLTVAVMVDVLYKKQGKSLTPVKRTEDEIKNLKNLVEKAIGFDKARGDQVEIQEIEFQHPDYSAADSYLEQVRKQNMIYYFGKLGGLVLFGLALLFFVAVPIIRWLTASPTVAAIVRSTGGGQTIAAEPNAIGKSIDDKRDEIKNMVLKDPERTVQALRGWLES